MDKEICRIYRSIGRKGRKARQVIVIGFDSPSPKYYFSAARLETNTDKAQKQFFSNYQEISTALHEQTGLSIVEVVEGSA